MKKSIIFILLMTLNAAFGYLVQKGDTGFSIARSARITFAELRMLNPSVLDWTKIQPGQRLNTETVDMTRLISAFIYVESRGKDNAVGDDGQAVGCLQLHPIMVDEANRLAKPVVKYTYDDRTSREKSIEMFKILMTHHRVKNVREAVRVWNRNAPEFIIARYIKAYQERK